MKKRIIIDGLPDADVLDSSWLDLEALAEVEITSEDRDYPIEGALLADKNHGWKASKSGIQLIRLIFKQAQNIHRIHLVFLECNVVRTQEYVLRWSHDNGLTFNEIVRQQWNFSPDGNTMQSEDHTMALLGVTALELIITPDICQQNVFASLEQFRIG